MALSMNDFFAIWGWKAAPVFSKLDPSNPKHDVLFVDRENEMAAISEKLKIHTRISINRILLITGSPGCGKTTFMRYLARKLPNSSYFSLAVYASMDTTHQHRPLSVGDLIRFFAKIEGEILRVQKNSSVKTKPRATKIHTAYERNLLQSKRDDFSDLKELVEGVFLDLMEQKLADGLEHFLFIDNVDYLHPTDQCLILDMLCTLSKSEAGFHIVYAARPLAGAISNLVHREKFGKETEFVSQLTNINVRKPVEKRMEVERIDPTTSNRTFFSPETFELIENLSDGDIEQCYGIHRKAITAAPTYLNARNPIYTKDRFISLIIDEECEAKDRIVQDVFMPSIVTDKVPVYYCALKMFKEDRDVNEEFLMELNRTIADLYRPYKVSLPQMDKVLDDLRLYRCLRRRRYVGRAAKSSDFDTELTMLNFSCGLTRRGKAILELSKLEVYRENSHFARLPSGVRDEIKRDKLLGLTAYETSGMIHIEDPADPNLDE